MSVNLFQQLVDQFNSIISPYKAKKITSLIPNPKATLTATPKPVVPTAPVLQPTPKAPVPMPIKPNLLTPFTSGASATPTSNIKTSTQKPFTAKDLINAGVDKSLVTKFDNVLKAFPQMIQNVGKEMQKVPDYNFQSPKILGQNILNTQMVNPSSEMVRSFGRTIEKVPQRLQGKKFGLGENIEDIGNVLSVLPVGRLATEATPEIKAAANLLKKTANGKTIEALKNIVADIQTKGNIVSKEDLLFLENKAVGIFGEKARTATTKQLANIIDATLKRIGQTKNQFNLGLSVNDIREGKTKPNASQAGMGGVKKDLLTSFKKKTSQTLSQQEKLAQLKQGSQVVSPAKVELSPSSSSSISQDARKILTGTATKERGFITSVKESEKTPQAVKDIISGSYIPKSTASLKADAKALIQADAVKAEELALNPRNATDVQIGNELINHYGLQGNFAKAKQITEGMANSGTEFGQAVQAFANYDKTTPQGALKFAQGAVNTYKKAHPNSVLKITDEQVKNMFERATKIQAMPEGRLRNIASNDLMEEINNLIPSTFVDKAVTVWKAGLLTSLRTHERNIIGNLLHGTAEYAKDIPATVADKLLSLKTGKRTITFTSDGIISGTKKGLQSAKDIVTKGYDPEQAISKYDVKHVTWGNNPLEQGLKKYTDAVFRTLGAADKPFWNSSYARSLYDQAGAEAINVGKRGDKEFIENLVNKPTEQMLKNAVKDANVATFKNDTGLREVATAFKKVASKNELTKLGSEVIAPFTGVPSSIAGQIVAYSPIGLVKGIAKAGKVLVKDIPNLQRQASQEVGRGVIGTGLLGIGAYLASKGLITGQPKDDKEAKEWQLENKPSNSVFIGGKWLTINSIGPENLILLAGAKAQEEFGVGGGNDIGKLGGNIAKDFLGQTFLQGVQAPLNAINDPTRYGKAYLGGQGSSIIPNIVKDVSKFFDDNQRENNTISDYFTNSIPGLRNKNLPRRDALGNIIPQEPTGAGAFIDLFNSKTPKKGVVVDEFARLDKEGYNSMPSQLSKNQTINKKKMVLTPEQLNKLEAANGAVINKVLEQVFISPQYKALTDEKKSELIDLVVQRVGKAVKEKMNIKQVQAEGGYEVSPEAPKDLLEKFSLAAKGIAVGDWQNTVKAIFTQERMRRISGNALILERKVDLNTKHNGMVVDHIIPLGLGGDNSAENTRYITPQANSAKAKLETELIKKLKAGTIIKEEARRQVKAWVEKYEVKKSGSLLTPFMPKA
jgi:hypothetical protein